MWLWLRISPRRHSCGGDCPDPQSARAPSRRRGAEISDATPRRYFRRVLNARRRRPPANNFIGQMRGSKPSAYVNTGHCRCIFARVMRIGLDVHVLSDPHQGTTSVWLNLLSELPSSNEYILYSFAPAEMQRRFPQPHFVHRRIPSMPAAARIQLAFPIMTRRDRCDVFHANYYGPIMAGPPVVLQVHDVIYLDFPDYSTGTRRALFATLGRASARTAARVVTNSIW